MQPVGRAPKFNGVYVGFVKRVDDVQRNGRLYVWIPEMGSAPDSEDGWIIANYCSPFAGATNLNTANTTDVQTFEGSQTSYGMWMIPPDINNQVLVMFINGEQGRCIWIGCLYNQYMNNMVPGEAADANNYQYPGKKIPVAEYNKNDAKVTKPDRATKPFHATKFNGIGNQGLITDTDRGVTNASARREAPSEVFGFSTPGPAIIKDVKPDKIRRKGGSALIMDDATGSEHIQITTKSGAQININESSGFVYLINRDGTAWVQMDKLGNVEIFGAKNISMRAQRDFNIRADRNVNIEAGQNIFLKAAKDTAIGTTTFTYDVNNIPKASTIEEWGYVGEGKGTGGNIVMQALNNWHSTTKKGVFHTVVENSMNINVGNAVNVTTLTGGQNFNSAQGFKLSTKGAVDIASAGNLRVTSDGLISVVGASGIVLCTDADLSLNAQGDIIETAAGDISIDAVAVNVGTDILVSGNIDAIDIVSMSLDTSSIITVALDAASIVGTSITATDIGVSTLIYGSHSAGSVSVPAVPSPADPVSPTMVDPTLAEGALVAGTARMAEIKPLNNKTNILATWADSTPPTKWTNFSPAVKYKKDDAVRYDNEQGYPVYYKSNIDQGPSEFIPENWAIIKDKTNSKFKRNANSVQTIVSRFPTYEPCPEHETFDAANIAGLKPVITADDRSYSGSGGAGNDASSQPPSAANPGANNTSVDGDPVTDSNAAGNIPTNALRCQLIIHEGLKAVSYKDTMNLVTGGIGHLMRGNEISTYPVGTPIPATQIETWFSQDSASATRIAQELMGEVWSALSAIRKRAVIDLAYNLGKGGLSKFTQFIAAMKAQDFTKAGTCLRDSAWYKQVGKRGPNIITMITQSIDPNGCDKRYPE